MPRQTRVSIGEGVGLPNSRVVRFYTDLPIPKAQLLPILFLHIATYIKCPNYENKSFLLWIAMDTPSRGTKSFDFILTGFIEGGFDFW